MKLVPVAKKLSILTSRHPDGQIVAAAAESCGCSSIDGSGASFKQDEGTGGMAAMREMLREMKRGQSIGITADIPPVPGRNVSDGIALLARFSGRPIIPYAVSSSRRTVLENVWDKMQINHPFSRMTACIDEPIWVPKSAKDLELYSKELAMKLDRTTARAFELADKKRLALVSGNNSHGGIQRPGRSHAFNADFSASFCFGLIFKQGFKLVGQLQSINR